MPSTSVLQDLHHYLHPQKTRITGVNDYRPVALTSLIMKSFECLVLSHFKTITDRLLDCRLAACLQSPQGCSQFGQLGPHPPVPGLLRNLCQDPICGLRLFNTVFPGLFQDVLFQLHMPDCTCRWITDFRSDSKRHVKLGKPVSDFWTISTLSQGYILSPLLFSL